MRVAVCGLMKLLSGFALLAACGLVLFGPSGCSCTLVGCGSAVKTTLNVAGDPASLAGSTVTLCRNEDCRAGLLELSSDGTGLSCTFEDDALSVHNCHGVVAGDEVSIELSLTLNEDDPSEDDTFRFVIASAADPDDILAEVEGKPDYTESEPNGEWCEPTCYNATI